MAQALALHSSSVSPTEAGVPLFWKGTAVTRRLRSSALSRRADRVQKPQAPSNMRVRCCGSSVKVTNLIVPLLSGLTGKEATRMAGLLRNYCPIMLAWRNLSRNSCRVSVACKRQMQKSPQRPQIWLEIPKSSAQQRFSTRCLLPRPRRISQSGQSSLQQRQRPLGEEVGGVTVGVLVSNTVEGHACVC